ncbi:MAG: NTP transferase domain-containing protein [Actinomycetota bacterium]
MIAAIVLAAGRATRFGSPKQLAEVGGRTLVQHAVDAAADAGVDVVVVVLGHAADRVERELSLPRNARVVLNPAFAEGQSTSLRAGIGGLPPEAGAAVILLADQPGITALDVQAVIATHTATGARIVRARYRGIPGHPVLIAKELFPEVEGTTGDAGARDVLRDHADEIVEVDIDRDPPPDVDTPDDLMVARRDVSRPDNSG